MGECMSCAARCSALCAHSCANWGSRIHRPIIGCVAPSLIPAQELFALSSSCGVLAFDVCCSGQLCLGFRSSFLWLPSYISNSVHIERPRHLQSPEPLVSSFFHVLLTELIVFLVCSWSLLVFRESRRAPFVNMEFLFKLDSWELRWSRTSYIASLTSKKK